MNTNDQLAVLLKEITIPASNELIQDRFNPDNSKNASGCTGACDGKCGSGL